MITYILLLMIGLEIKMSTAYFIMLGIGAVIKLTAAGMDLQKKLSKED